MLRSRKFCKGRIRESESEFLKRWDSGAEVVNFWKVRVGSPSRNIWKDRVGVRVGYFTSDFATLLCRQNVVIFQQCINVSIWNDCFTRRWVGKLFSEINHSGSEWTILLQNYSGSKNEPKWIILVHFPADTTGEEPENVFTALLFIRLHRGHCCNQLWSSAVQVQTSFLFFFNPERATSEELKGRMRFRRRRFADPWAKRWLETLLHKRWVCKMCPGWKRPAILPKFLLIFVAYACHVFVMLLWCPSFLLYLLPLQLIIQPPCT